MTRSEIPLHKIAKKTFRAKASAEGKTFKEAAEERAKQLKSQKVLSPPGVKRRNPGRMDGMTWKGSSFIPNQKVDGHGGMILADDIYYDDGLDDWDESQPSILDQPVTVSLSDIARPAKRKGITKDFEVVSSVQRVIALDDIEQNTFELWPDDEEWEELCGEQDVQERKSYSAVLRGNDR